MLTDITSFLKINEDQENPATFGWSQPDGPRGLAMTSARRGSKASPKVRVRREHELWIFQCTLNQRSFAIWIGGFYCFIELLTSLTSTTCLQRWTSFPVSCIRLWVACPKHHSHHSRSLSSAWMTDCRTEMWLVSGIASPMRYRRSWATVSQQPLRPATRSCQEHQIATCPNGSKEEFQWISWYVASEKLDFDVQAYKTPCQVVEQAEVVALMLSTWPMFVRWYSNILQQIRKTMQNCNNTKRHLGLPFCTALSPSLYAKLNIGPKLNGKGRRHRYSQCSMNPLQVCLCVRKHNQKGLLDYILRIVNVYKWWMYVYTAVYTVHVYKNCDTTYFVFVHLPAFSCFSCLLAQSSVILG